MLYLCILVAFPLSYAQTVSIDHELPSLVKSRGDQSTARITCQISQRSSDSVHWYVQNNEVIKRIQGKTGYEDGIDQTKFTFTATTTTNKKTLSINRLTDDDSGIYYCTSLQREGPGYSYNVFGHGTKLIITYQKVRKPDVTIFASSKRDLKTKNSATLLCNLQNFFPDVIIVKWIVAGSNHELKSEQGEIITNAFSNMSSVYSWITINNSDIGKIYKCRYRHEGNLKGWEEVQYNTEQLLDKDLKRTDINNCTSGDTGGKPIIIRTAQLIYALLLLKGFIYCPLLLLFKYKAPE